MVDSIFVGLSVLTIGSAILSLESRELLYGGVALAISMLGIAGFFIILDAPFVAMFQIAVYVGAVAVLIIFTVMLVRAPNTVTKKETRKRKVGGILLGLAFLILAGSILGNSSVTQLKFNDTAPIVDVQAIGKELVTYYSPVLIVLALTLAAAVIGTLTLARREDIEERNEPAS